MLVVNLWDGAKSFVAAILTVVLCGIPSWFTHVAIDLGVAPMWAYVPVAGLVVVAVLLTLAFLEKAIGGISPSRDRRRRGSNK